MYYKEDLYLKKEFERICQLESEKERLEAFDKFFCLSLPKHNENYEIKSLTDNPFIGIVVKDKLHNLTYYANYQKDSRLIMHKSENFDFINVRTSYAEVTEREKTYYRFRHIFDAQPLHDEISTVFPGNYKLTITRKYPSWYPLIEQGIYISLYDIKNSFILYHNKIEIFPHEIDDKVPNPEIAFVRDFYTNDYELWEKKHYCMNFEGIVNCYLKNRNKILNEILKKINA